MSTEPQTLTPETEARPRGPIARLIIALRSLLQRLDGWLEARLGIRPVPTRASHGPSSKELAGIRMLLATGRTLLSADRSLMAWMRTALAMLSFGFTIYKLLQGFQDSGQLGSSHSPRTIGLFLTALGTGAMFAGTWDYLHTLKALRQFHVIPLWRPSFVFAVVLGFAGVFLFFSIFLKMF